MVVDAAAAAAAAAAGSLGEGWRSGEAEDGEGRPFWSWNGSKNKVSVPFSLGFEVYCLGMKALFEVHLLRCCLKKELHLTFPRVGSFIP